MPSFNLGYVASSVVSSVALSVEYLVVAGAGGGGFACGAGGGAGG